MPPETAVIEPEAQPTVPLEEGTPPEPQAPEEPGIAEPATPEVSPEGEAEGADEGTKLDLIREVFKGATVAELKAALEEVPAEIRTELESEIERRGEQRAKTRESERDKAVSERRTEHEQKLALAKQATPFLVQRFQAARQGNLDALTEVPVDTLAGAVDAFVEGQRAELYLANEGTLASARNIVLAKATEEEKAKLEPLIYRDDTKATIEEVPLLIEIAFEAGKREGLDEGMTKGQQSKQAKLALAEKVEKIMEIKKQAPGVQPKGTRSITKEDARAALAKEMSSINQFTPEGREEWQRREPEFKRRLRELQGD